LQSWQGAQRLASSVRPNVAAPPAVCDGRQLRHVRHHLRLFTILLCGWVASSSGDKQLMVQVFASHTFAGVMHSQIAAKPESESDLMDAIGQGKFLRYDNGSISKFGSCNQACEQCFIDHYQGCLAYCRIGCEDYCAEKLPPPECLAKQQWVARLGHVFQAFDGTARLCQATGVNGCPLPPPQSYSTTQMPFDPYAAAETDEQQSNGKPIPETNKYHPRAFLGFRGHAWHNAQHRQHALISFSTLAG